MNKILRDQFMIDQLSDNQKETITNINSYINKSIKGNQHAVAVIQGAAGTGKSVVLMNLVTKYMTDKRYKTALVVNHPELFKAYQDLAHDIPGMKEKDILRPTALINRAQKNNWKYDVIFVDEAHLLYSKPTAQKPLMPFPRNSDFDFKVFSTAGDLYEEVKAKNREVGLSRVVATSGFPRINGRHNVEMDTFSLPWDEWDPQRTHWAKRESSITQVGTIYTLQGFDLNYVGMIIGPSFGYDNKTDSMTILPEKYSHKEIFKKRKDIKFTSKEYQDFIANVLNVLIKRGKYGMYLTAYDDQLRQRLVDLYQNKR
jgi:DUF2075 family protein